MTSQPQPSPPGGGTAHRYTGQVVYIFAYDVAYVIDVAGLDRLLGEPVEQFEVYLGKRGPREMLFYRPRMVRLPPTERVGPHGSVAVGCSVKLFPVGAVSVSIHVPFRVEHIEDLALYHDLRFQQRPLENEAKRLAAQVRDELGARAVRPVAQLRDEEAYTLFCIESPVTSREGQPMSAENWLLRHRRQVASVLTQEMDIANLSEQEADESTDMFLSYYEKDLTVIDWDAALVIDEPGNWAQTQHVMELANVQLAELEAYDHMLDEALDRSYRDLSRRGRRPSGNVLAGLREIRVDLARVTDELSNITKFFGDWHLARIYQHLSARFHLSDWRGVLGEKLQTLDDLYQILKQDQLNRWMLILEVTIVLLFVIDLVVLLAGLWK